jgi:hypothetical protein
MQALGEESMSRIRKVQRPKEVRQVKSKVKSMLIIFFDIKGIVHKIRPGRPNSSLTSVTFYGDCVKICKEFPPNFGEEKNWLFCHDNAASHACFFTREFFTKNSVTLGHNPPQFSLFPSLKIKLKCLHFDAVEVIEAESPAVLNTLTQHDFQDAIQT